MSSSETCGFVPASPTWVGSLLSSALFHVPGGWALGGAENHTEELEAARDYTNIRYTIGEDIPYFQKGLEK